MANYPLKGELVQMRYLQEEDIPALMLIANDALIRKNTGESFPYPYDLRAAQFRVREGAKKEYGSEDFGIFLGTTLIGGGGIELQKGRRLKNIHIGYWIGKPYRGNGYATDFVKVMIEYAFQKYDILRMYSSVFSFNPSSARVLEKCGFIREGSLKNAILYGDELADERIYGLTKNQS